MAITLNGTTGITTPAIDNQGDLTVDTNTLFVDSANNSVGIGTSSPSQKLHVEGAGNQFILLNNSTTNDGFYFKAGAGASSIQTNAGSHVMNFFTSGAERMKIDSTGAVTMPYQPAFLARPAISQDNIAITTNVDIAFGTEIFDQNSDFASSVFTAPVDGKYFFACGVAVENLDSAASFYEIYLKTSNLNIYITMDPDFGQDATYWTFSHSVLHTMDAGDTCKVQIYQGCWQFPNRYTNRHHGFQRLPS
jgi:hypothetical protein